MAALTGHGVLWRLRHSTGQQLSCQVCKVGGECFLVIRELITSLVPVAEAHADVASLCDRAESLRQAWVVAGWQAYDLASNS